MAEALSEPESQPLIQVRELTTSFYSRDGVARAVDGVSFELRRGETLGLVGRAAAASHKTFHSALSDKPGRRAIHINCVQNTTPEKNQAHFDWLVGFLEGETKRWGRFYSDRLISTAGARRQKMMGRTIELGFGNSGPITHLQDLQ